MEDLISEQEFAESQYTPWKSFKRFYVFAVVQMVIIFIIQSYFRGSTLLGIVCLALPPITVVLMFKHHKKNMEASQRTKMLGILGLIASYYIPFAGYTMLNQPFSVREPMSFWNLLVPLVAIFGIYVAEFGFCTFLIFAISSFRVKKRM
jgi:magnesium-transporting ATPase (P-type)